jgi:nucleotide-binding universal stress UspA family protein
MAQKMFRFKRILCAVDFSPASTRAFEFALQLASIHGARIQLLHVIPRIIASVMDVPITTSRWTAAQEEEATRELAKLRERASKSGIAADTEIRLGDIDLQILKVANETRADLLVIGTHGRRGFERWVLGSVAERMLRHSPIPILLTASTGKRAAAGVIRHILIPSDFSRGTADAIGYGVGIADQAGASVTILHVIQDRSPAVDWNAGSAESAAIQQRLEGLVPLGARRLCEIDTRVENGQPYQEILRVIQDSKPSLVVLNTHGHGFLDRALIGSTAERVVRGGAALCPLLLIPLRAKSAL